MVDTQLARLGSLARAEDESIVHLSRKELDALLPEVARLAEAT